VRAILFFLAFGFLLFASSFAIKPSFVESHSLKEQEASSQDQEEILMALAVSKSESAKTRVIKITEKSEDQLKAKAVPFVKETPKPLVEKKVLRAKLNEHLSDVRLVCELKNKKQKTLFEKLNSLRSFLRSSLEDPYMNYELAILFADISSVLEEENWRTYSDFNRAYKLLYNIGESVKFENYEHVWAKDIIVGLQCGIEI